MEQIFQHIVNMCLNQLIMENFLTGTPIPSIEWKKKVVAVKDEWKPDLSNIVAQGNKQRMVPSITETDVPRRYIWEFDNTIAVVHEGLIILECQVITKFQCDLFREIESEGDVPIGVTNLLAAEAAGHARVYWIWMTTMQGLGAFQMGTEWDVFEEPLDQMWRKFLRSDSRNHQK